MSEIGALRRFRQSVRTVRWEKPQIERDSKPAHRRLADGMENRALAVVALRQTVCFRANFMKQPPWGRHGSCCFSAAPRSAFGCTQSLSAPVGKALDMPLSQNRCQRRTKRYFWVRFPYAARLTVRGSARLKMSGRRTLRHVRLDCENRRVDEIPSTGRFQARLRALHETTDSRAFRRLRARMQRAIRRRGKGDPSSLNADIGSAFPKPWTRPFTAIFF